MDKPKAAPTPLAGRQAGPLPAARYDERERRAAARITAGHPAWLVIWGTWSRRYWAFMTGSPHPVIISASSAGGLLTRIAAAEFHTAPGWPDGGPPRLRQARPELMRRPGRA